MLRRSGRFGKSPRLPIYPVLEDTSDILQKKWLAWVEQESFRRMVYHCLVMEAHVSLSMSTNALISFAELQVPMPQSRDLWNAPNAEAWKTAYMSRNRKKENSSLVEYLQGTVEIDEDYDRPFCHLIVLSGIWGMAWTSHQDCAVLGKPRHLDAALTLRHQELLRALHTFRIGSEGEEQDDTLWDPTVHMLYELIMMRLHVPFTEVELFAGKGDQNDARQALPMLLEWSTSEESRKAVWYSGQVLRSAERFGHARLRGFYSISLYQAGLTLWTYAVVSHIRSPSSSASSASVDAQPLVWLNGPDSVAVQRFLSSGKPAMAAIHAKGAAADPSQTASVPVLDAMAVLDVVQGLLRSNFAHWEAVPPLVENLAQLLENLGLAAANVRP